MEFRINYKDSTFYCLVENDIIRPFIVERKSRISGMNNMVQPLEPINARTYKGHVLLDFLFKERETVQVHSVSIEFKPREDDWIFIKALTKVSERNYALWRNLLTSLLKTHNKNLVIEKLSPLILSEELSSK